MWQDLELLNGQLKKKNEKKEKQEKEKDKRLGKKK